MSASEKMCYALKRGIGKSLKGANAGGEIMWIDISGDSTMELFLEACVCACTHKPFPQFDLKLPFFDSQCKL